MAAGEQVPADEATRRVRVSHAARRLYQLRAVLGAYDQSATPGARAARRVRQAERRAQSALIRAGFADAAVAAAVLSHVQVLAMTATLARLDYRTADAGQAAIASLITSPATAAPRLDAGASAGHPATPGDAGGHDAQLIAAAARIVAAAMQAGDRLSQAALAGQLRREGYTVANGRLRWLACASGLEPAPPPSRTGTRWQAGDGTRRPGRRPSHAARGQRAAACRVAHPGAGDGPGDPNRRPGRSGPRRTGAGACEQPHGCLAKAGRTSCSSPPAYQTRP